MAVWLYCFLIAALTFTGAVRSELNTNEQEAREFAEMVNARSEEATYRYLLAAWDFETNITDANEEAMTNEELKLDEFDREVAVNASKFDWKNFSDKNLTKLFSHLTDMGTAAMPDKDKLKRLSSVKTTMSRIYSTGEVCLDKNQCLPLDPDLSTILAESRDYDKLLKVWTGWRASTGAKIRDLYEEFVSLSNEAIVANGYKDTGAYWRSWYASPNFEENLVKLFDTLQPLYANLHAYTRRKLKELYGEDKFPSNGQIPAHLLGNMWAQSWSNLYTILEPFKNKTRIDVTKEMRKQNYTAKKMFEISDEFFTSLGLLPMPDKFWNYSMLTKPTDGREVVCHASAWDFYNREDFRIKQCTYITMEDLVTVHHEMGHIQYYLQYKDLPVVYRDGANPGFHEAVGDVISLSVQTPKHLQEIGLAKDIASNREADINYMMKIALQNIAFLPFGYLMDKWRWSVFSGETPKSKYNTKWWELRCKYQGVSPPVARSENDFDPGAKFHIPDNTPYIRYFVSLILQFQFHKALCNASNQTGPLHECDIYRSREAGKLFGDMLKLGSSVSWPEALKMITGETEMKADAIVEYFQPLTDWLKEQNDKDVGWEESCPSTDPISASTVHSLSLPLLLTILVSTLFRFY